MRLDNFHVDYCKQLVISHTESTVSCC